MKHCSYIAARRVCSDYPYIVYGPTTGLTAGSYSFEQAQQSWQAQRAQCRERGHESDALLFEWLHNQWIMCGDLYEAQGARGLMRQCV